MHYRSFLIYVVKLGYTVVSVGVTPLKKVYQINLVVACHRAVRKIPCYKLGRKPFTKNFNQIYGRASERKR